MASDKCLEFDRPGVTSYKTDSLDVTPYKIDWSKCPTVILQKWLDQEV